MADTPKPAVREWTVVEQKARVLAEGSKLDGEKLAAYLERQGMKLAEYEQWRIALMRADEPRRRRTAISLERSISFARSEQRISVVAFL